MDYGSFVGPTYTLQNISADCQRCMNLYPQADESGAGKNQAYLLSTPGLIRVSDLTNIIGGPISPEAATSITWTNPNNILAKDGSFTTGQPQTHYSGSGTSTFGLVTSTGSGVPWTNPENILDPTLVTTCNFTEGAAPIVSPLPPTTISTSADSGHPFGFIQQFYTFSPGTVTQFTINIQAEVVEDGTSFSAINMDYSVDNGATWIFIDAQNNTFGPIDEVVSGSFDASMLQIRIQAAAQWLDSDPMSIEVDINSITVVGTSSPSDLASQTLTLPVTSYIPVTAATLTFDGFYTGDSVIVTVDGTNFTLTTSSATYTLSLGASIPSSIVITAAASGPSLATLNNLAINYTYSFDATNEITITDFPVFVPPAGTVAEVILTLRGMRDIDCDISAQLVVANTPVGTAITVSVPASISDFEIGGAISLWGTTLTPADVNGSGFGFLISAVSTGDPTATVSLDYAYMMVGTTSTGPVRCLYTASNDRFFAVVGSYLIELNSSYAVIGSYVLPNETGTGPVSMTDNGRDMMIVTGPNGYWFHFADNGAIDTMAIDVPGTGWAAGDTFTIAGGTGGIGTVDAVTGGVPDSISISNEGDAYTAGTGVATTAQLPSVGAGLTVTITTQAANTLTQITDDVFEGATTCGFIDGYIVFNQPGTQIFWITNLYSTVINPLGFAAAEGNPDNLLSLLVDHREIWLFGDTSTEVWYDSGNANFPFSFIQGAYISHGIVAPFSAVRLDNTTFWLGNDEFGSGIVWRANGYAPVRISNFAVEQAIQRYPTISDAVAWTYQQDGHSFYVLNFPSGDATWVYDAANGNWHERAYLGTLASNDGQLHRGRPDTHAFAFGKHIVGDWEVGYLYHLTPSEFDDDAREVKRFRRAPFIDDELRRVFFSQFQLDLEVGMGNPDATDPVTPPAPPVDPQITLRWSDDGGYTWSSEHTISIGLSGQYRKRVIWRRLGQARSRTFEVSTSQHDIGLSLYNAYLELEAGSS